MVVSVFLRHFKIYKNINYIQLSEGVNFSSIIGENGCGKSSILEALDFCFNKKNIDWPVNNEAKNDGGFGGDNFPYILPVFLIRKDRLRNSLKNDSELYKKAELLSEYLWSTTYKTKGRGFDEFYIHRDRLKTIYDTSEYFLIMVGKRYNDNGVYFGSFNNQLTFITANQHIQYSEKELQDYFKGFNEYIYSHYSFLYIPVETDVNTYTKLETLDMQKLMDKNIQKEIEKAIKPKTINQINKDLGKFVMEIEQILGVYHYKGHHKNQLTMPDLVSKIIEAYFSIKVLNKKVGNNRSIPVSDLSSGEKRKALIDVAYSFLLKNTDRNTNIILAIDEPEASLHISNCYEQFDKLFRVSKDNHQIIVSTHWYGFLPITTNGSATAIKKNDKNEISYTFLNLYNYRENIIHKKKQYKGVLPIDYDIKSYNDLIQSMIHSIMSKHAYNWIVCEGQSEKIYFDYYFADEIIDKNLRILPVGGYKEVSKIYSYLLTPIKDPDYEIVGKVYCLIDTDAQRIEVKDYQRDRNLFFDRLLFREKESILVEVSSNLVNPPTEIEDCLNPIVFYQTLLEFISEYPNIYELVREKDLEDSKYSATFLDMTSKEKAMIKEFFNDNEGYNKILFAKKYVELINMKFFQNERELSWVNDIKSKMELA